MKYKKTSSLRFVCVLLIMLLITLLGAIGVQADSNNCELDIFYRHEEKPIAGVQASAYLVGNYDTEGDITLSGNFSDYSINTSTDDLSALAQTLYGYALVDKLVPEYTAVSDETGMASMTGMQKGVYLITSKRHVKDDDVYITEPQLMFLPWRENSDEEWIYSRTMMAKCRMISMDDNTISVKALKVWDDKNNENSRPNSIKVTLLQDDEIYETVELSAENNWRYTWEWLPPYYVWNVVEEIPDNYEVIQTQKGVTRIINNTYSNTTPTEPASIPETTTPSISETDSSISSSNPSEEEKLPQTGMLWWPVPVLTISGIILIVIGCIKRKGEKFEA